ncbi:MAG: aminotransferase class III-fold pyridoxal phosphate-dependent enzyme, partial [Myxococcales bacterium]|nr:aminotransferase class III-fold pyridoxal phosphate-dependent enzyme [Myxococcales bacterium]
TYWPEVKRILAGRDILFVADEVITGFGRTGEWFGSTTYDLEPDMMTLAKALTSGYVPLSAVMVGDRVAERLAASGGKLMHGFTYSGHPAAAAVALENLRLLEDEGHVDRVREETGPHLQRRLREVFADHPLVGEVRGTGLIAAVELVADKAARRLFDPPGEVGLRCLDHCFDLGVIPRSVRDGMCLSPPLVITAPEIDEMIARLREAVDRTARDLGRA